MLFRVRTEELFNAGEMPADGTMLTQVGMNSVTL